MKNIFLISDIRKAIDLGNSSPASDTVANFVLDHVEGNLYLITTLGRVLFVSTSSWVAEWSVETAPACNSEVSIAGFDLVPELEGVCIALGSGEILLIQQDGAMEEVGFVGGGICCVAWSPDGHMAALLTGNGTLLIMNQNWTVLCEQQLIVGTQEAVAITSGSIAWRGDGQYVAVLMATGGGAETVVLRRDDWTVCSRGEHPQQIGDVMSWQINGRHLYVAGKPPTASTESQQVLLYETNGLQHGSFSVTPNGHIVSMSWSSTSEYLAIMLRPHSPASASTSPDSPTTTTTTTSSSSPPASFCLQLWHRSNWQWYLKWERQYHNTSHVSVHWEEGPHLIMHVVTGGALYQTLQWIADYDASERGTVAVINGCDICVTPLQYTVVPPPMCVVTISCGGPVSCLAVEQYGHSEAVCCVSSSGGVWVVESVEEDLWEETWEELWADRCPTPTARIPACEVQCAADLSQVRGICWVGARKLAAVCAGQPNKEGRDSHDELMLLDLKVEEGTRGTDQKWSCEVTGSYILPDAVCRLVSSPLGGALMQLHGGQMMMVDGTGEPQPLAASLPCTCPWICATPAEPLYTTGASRPDVVGLSSSHDLYWGTTQIATDCNSLAVRSGGPGGSFLLYTLRGSQQLHAITFDQQAQTASARAAAVSTQPPQHQQGLIQNRGLGNNSAVYTAMHSAMRPKSSVSAAVDVNVRALEDGSELVAVPKGGVAVVLQMPRGNLEVVYPRALVLAAVALAVQHQDYAEAWSLATRHRLDLNVLVDYQWPAFIDNAAQFVSCVSSDSDIADFLAYLQPGSIVAAGSQYAWINTLKTTDKLMDSSPLPASPETNTEHTTDKLPTVCKAVRNALEAAGKERYLKSILTSLAKEDALEDALLMVKEVKEKELAHAEDKEFEDGSAAEEGLMHLLLSVDVEKMYRCALGLYELELAYMVISLSQRDPGEYMVQLQGFASRGPPALMRHAIDVHLGRWERAVQHLVAAGGEQHFEEALKLAQQKGLLRTMLSLFPGSEHQEKRAIIMKAYGDTLSTKNKDEDAAVAYVAAGELGMALDAYRRAGEWKMVFVMAGRLGYDEDAVQRLASDLVNDLQMMHRLACAAQVALEYLDDADNGVLLLTEAQHWRHALAAAYGKGRDDLCETVIAPAAAHRSATLMEDIKETTEKIKKYHARLKEVRQKRLDMQAVIESGEVADPHDIPDDTVSEAGSVVSGISAYTAASTAAASTTSTSSRGPSTVGGRRQRQKKKSKASSTRIRQGSPQEEAALCEHIKSLKPQDKLLTEASQLMELLILLGHEDDARLMQQSLSEWLVTQINAADDIARNPPPPPPPGRDTHNRNKVEGKEVPWKWAILRAPTNEDE